MTAGSRSHAFSALAVAVLAPAVLAVVMYPFRNTLAAPALPMLFVLPVVVAAMIGGRGPAVLAALVGAAAFDFFLTEPFWSFRIHGQADVVVAVTLAVVGLAVAELVSSRDRSAALARQRARDLASLQRVAGLGAGSEDRGWLIVAAETELEELLDVPAIEFRPGAVPADAIRLGHGKLTVPAARPERAARPLVVPVAAAGREIGYFVVAQPPGRVFSLSSQRRAQAIAVADLLGAALARTPNASAN
jgi:K+-sensing histidine kinase KdpD